eukprot:2865020-Amphidinium_carterae.1
MAFISFLDPNVYYSVGHKLHQHAPEDFESGHLVVDRSSYFGLGGFLVLSARYKPERYLVRQCRWDREELERIGADGDQGKSADAEPQVSCAAHQHAASEPNAKVDILAWSPRNTCAPVQNSVVQILVESGAEAAVDFNSDSQKIS